MLPPSIASRHGPLAALSLPQFHLALLPLPLRHEAPVIILEGWYGTLGVVLLWRSQLFPEGVHLVGRGPPHLHGARGGVGKGLWLTVRSRRHGGAAHARLFSCLFGGRQWWSTHRIGLRSTISLHIGCRVSTRRRSPRAGARIAGIICAMTLGSLRSAIGWIVGGRTWMHSWGSVHGLTVGRARGCRGRRGSVLGRRRRVSRGRRTAEHRGY